MTDNPYSNRELDEKLDRIYDKLHQVHQQTKKTNGRVDTLEKEVEKTTTWKAYMMGALGVLSFMLTSLLIPMAFIAVNYFLEK